MHVSNGVWAWPESPIQQSVGGARISWTVEYGRGPNLLDSRVWAGPKSLRQQGVGRARISMRVGGAHIFQSHDI